jgi:hypothetical protein
MKHILLQKDSNLHSLWTCNTRVKNYPHYRYVLQLAILLVGYDKIHMVYSSPITVVQV